MRRGPFTGLRYGDELLDTSGDLVAKLVGAYEAELHASLETWLGPGPRTVVNVGAGEGYYAVGLAVARADVQVLAFDIDERARWLCTEMAGRNGVTDRVRIAAACTLDSLRALPGDAVAAMFDCEGCEAALVRPDLIEPMRTWPLLIELHDFIDPTISARVLERTAATHEATIVPAQPRAVAAYPELGFLSASDAALALSERRPAGMRWALLMPRSTA